MEFDNPLSILCNDIIYGTSDTIIRLIYKYLHNISQNPLIAKYRTIKLTNKTFEKVWEYPECQELFLTISYIPSYLDTEIGFEIDEDNSSISLGSDKSLNGLNDCLQYFDEFDKQCKEKEQDNLMMRGDSQKSVLQLPTGASHPHQTELHFAAMKGDIDLMRSLLQSHPEWVHIKDENQWQPLHEAARKGCVESIQLLLTHGADPEARTRNGGNPLWWAEEYHPSNHPCIALLKQHTGEVSPSSNPLPPHTSRQSLPSKYCQVCWKEVFHYSTTHPHYVKYRDRFLTRAPHPNAAIQCKTCKQFSDELSVRAKLTVNNTEKEALLSQMNILFVVNVIIFKEVITIQHMLMKYSTLLNLPQPFSLLICCSVI